MSFIPVLEFEGWDELADDWSRHADYLTQDLEHATNVAAEAAVQEMQTNHSYTDRTYLLSGGMYVRPGRRSLRAAESVVDFKAKYAQAVDQGVPGHSRPYPFSPQGMAKAEQVLETCVEDILERWCDSMAR